MPKPRRVWLLWLSVSAFVVLVSAVGLFIIFGMQNPGLANADSGLNESSTRKLQELNFCDVAARFDIPVDVLAGVVLAEDQLNRDVLDSIQDGWANFLIFIHDEQWWSNWAESPSSAGITISLGPSQITPLTALNACAQLGNRPDVCAHGAKHLIASIMNTEDSLDVAAVVLVAEREDHLAKTGIDIQSNTAAWATIYNFGGDPYRDFFTNPTEQNTNRFGRWIGRNSSDISSQLGCDTQVP